MASSFPFAPARAGPALNASTANAINAHLTEISMLRHPADTPGTVLAVVTFPRDKSSLACDGEPWRDTRLRMSYDRLMGLGSKVIRDMFTPRAQARFRRRLGLGQLPPGIEYVLDFTPPSEGPELADLTAALWLPRMVKLWFLAGQYLPGAILENVNGTRSRPLAEKAVGAILALGHDDVCKAGGCLTDFSEWEPKKVVLGIIEDDPAAGLCHVPEWRRVDDYCPIRHRVAIIRVLKAISGGDLLLNSAVRMWTVAQVAISLDVPQVVVDPVTQWLVAPPNTKFIEICPERAFQLAYSLKIPSVLIASFRILVNELAIDYASSHPAPGRPQLTWAQRRRDDYGDYPSDPVEYASRAFADRMHGMLKALLSDDVFDQLPQPNPQWQKLQYLGSLITALPGGTPLHVAYLDLVAALRSALRRWVDEALGPEALCTGAPGHLAELLEAQRRHYIPPADSTPFAHLYLSLNPSQKVLTSFFWNRLAWAEVYSDFSNDVTTGRSLSVRAEAFNRHLRHALSDADIDAPISPGPDHPAIEARISPDPDHPALAAAAAAAANGGPAAWDFDLAAFHTSLRGALGALCSRARGHHADPDGAVPFFLSDHHLLSLEEPELNYLPIWADGLDDGSGGVFQDAIPPAEMGPSEPGPAYHTGFTAVPTAPSTAPSDLGFDALSVGGGTATAGGSVCAQRSRSAARGTSAAGSWVLAGAATPSAAASESFTLGEDESAYAAARGASLSAPGPQGQAAERRVDGAQGTAGGSGIVDEDEGDEDEFGSDDGSSTLDGFEELDLSVGTMG